MSDNLEDKYLTVEEVSKYLKVSRGTVRTMTKSKGLPSIKVGNRVLFDRVEVDKWVKNQSVK